MTIKVILKDEKYDWRKIKIHPITHEEFLQWLSRRAKKGPIKIAKD